MNVSYLLRGGLFRGSLLGRSSLLLLASLELRRELVRVLDLDEISAGHSGLEGTEEDSVLPLLFRRKLVLHELLDGDHGGSRTILEFRNGNDDTGFVRHGERV